MARALRVDKLTLAALQATLTHYRGGDQSALELPVIDMLFVQPDELRKRAARLIKMVQERSGDIELELVSTKGQVGGGAMPLISLAGYGVALASPTGKLESLAKALRTGEPAVLARVFQERVILDVRTVLNDEQLTLLAQAIVNAVARTEK